MSKMETRERLNNAAPLTSSDEAQKVEKIFSDHFHLATKTMKLEAALHTGYTAASNYLAARTEIRQKGERLRGGVREVK